MVIIGRLTKDAVITELKDERKVVGFTVAVNDYYKPKGHEKGIQVTNYFQCSYWMSPVIAEKLKKGTLVELSGRTGINAYITMQGDAKASLTFHVNTITIHQFVKNESTESTKEGKTRKKKEEKETVAEDLPF